MSLKNLLRLRHTLALRLTLWYTGIFTISSFLALLVFYILITSVIQEHTDKNLLKEFEEFSSLLALEGMNQIKTTIVFISKNEGVEKMFFRVLDMNGQVIDASNMSSWGKIEISRTALKQLTYGTIHVFETQALRKHKARILYGMIAPGMTLQIGESLEEDARFMEIFRTTFGIIMFILMFFAALTGWFMARRALAGVGEVTQTARHISKGAFEQRVPLKARGHEIEQLAITFNSMLDRIHLLVTGMREMTDNIAHDLKSPITRIRGTAEVTLTSGKSTDEYETMAANTIEECDRLLEMINAMLDISEVESGAARLKTKELDITAVIRNACDLFQPIAEDKGITIVSKVPAECRVYGNIQSLQRLVANLLDNALKYTPSGGTVTVSADGNEDQVVISFNDTGIGISENDLPNIFKRFYRCDQSRSQVGVGLGLSLAKAIAKAHGGDITATSMPGKGSTFTVIFPYLPPL